MSGPVLFSHVPPEVLAFIDTSLERFELPASGDVKGFFPPVNPGMISQKNSAAAPIMMT